MKSFLALLGRLGNAILNAVNKAKRKDAIDDPAGNISNGGRVRESDESFSDLASKPRSDKTE